MLRVGGLYSLVGSNPMVVTQIMPRWWNADTLGLGPSFRKGVRVRVSRGVPNNAFVGELVYPSG